MEELFTNSQELETFLNLKAKGRLLALDREARDFSDELDRIIAESSQIFGEGNPNYLVDIRNIDTKILNSQNSDEELEALFKEKEEVLAKYESFVKSLPLTVREDIEFYERQILDRKIRLEEDEDLIRQINETFPNAAGMDYQSAVDSVEVLKDIDTYISQGMEAPVEEEVIEDQPHVVRITEASDDLEDEIQLEEVVPEEIQIDTSFLEPDSSLATAIETEKVVPDFTEHVEEEPERIIPVEPEDSISLLDAVEEIVPSEEEKITYVMDPGESLAGLSRDIYDTEDGYLAIYEANKELIDDVLRKNNLTHEDPFQNNEVIFAGLELVIPTTFTIHKEAGKGLSR